MGLGLYIIIGFFCCLFFLLAWASNSLSMPIPQNITHMSQYILWWFAPQYKNRNPGESCPDGYQNNGITGIDGCIKNNTF
jgi:hypothetical protein